MFVLLKSFDAKVDAEDDTVPGITIVGSKVGGRKGGGGIPRAT